MNPIKDFFIRVVSAPSISDEEDKRRQKRLNIILLMIFLGAFFVLLGEARRNFLLSDSLGLDSASLLTYVTGVLLLVVTAILYVLNRYVSQTLAGALLVFILVLVIPFSDSFENVAFGRSLIAFTLPITLAAMILQPIYSYLTAALSSIILTYISVWILGAPLPNIPAIAIFFMLAWLSHTSSSGLLDALKKLKASYQNLQQSEQRYRGVFDGVNDAIIVGTPFGQVLDINDSACRMFGWNYGEFLEKTVVDMLPADDTPNVDERGALSLSENTFEVVLVRANGEHFPAAARASFQDIGDEERLLIVIRDITKEKREEKELIQAKEDAEAAARAKADFLANMSHEIRTPLNAIYGMTSLMLDTPLDDEQQDFIETIRAGSDTLLNVINDILDFSKIEAGKLELEIQPFYVRNCVEEALDLLTEKAANKMLDLAYMIEEGTPSVVLGDVTRLRQILVNLLTNGIKFTDTGEVVVSVRSMLLENEQYELTFSVRDTGIGIPKDKMDKLFKSFSQVDSSTTRKYGGTGLGLAISRELVEKMGGTLWVESEEGKGSTFHFTIIVDSEPDAEPSPFDGVQPLLVDKRILIVDDNATNRKILHKQTLSWGMQPTTVESGEQALALLKDGEPFDIAILDMQMPGINGFMLARKISEMGLNIALPMIILTSIKREKARAGDVKIAAFLNKPIKSSNLHRILTDIISSAPSSQAKTKRKSDLDPTLAEKYPLRILLTEDNLINQKVTLKLLSHLGYRADLANNGIEALEALERQTYDVVFMDIQMPEMDGDEATRRIRENFPPERQPHIVAMTAHALEGDREKYLERGMDDYVSKPINIDALIAVLESVKSRS